MFNNIQKICIETFVLTLHSRLWTANFLWRHSKPNNDVRRKYVVKYIICEITLKEDKIWIIVDEIFRIVIIYMYITHSILHWFNYLIDLQTETNLAQNLDARPNTSGVLQLCKNYCARYHFHIMSFESFKLIKIRQDVYIWNLRCV